MSKKTDSKYKKLLLSILLDGVGYISLIPIFAFFDIIWAPLSGYIMTKMYKGNTGKIAGAIVFIEEAMPWLDIIPTFTLMWIYTYVLNPEKEVIEVEGN